MKFTDEHWLVFRLYAQEGKSYARIGELTGLTRQRIKDLIAEMRKAEPDLFPVETESQNFGQQNMYRKGRGLGRFSNTEAKRKF